MVYCKCNIENVHGLTAKSWVTGIWVVFLFYLFFGGLFTGGGVLKKNPFSMVRTRGESNINQHSLIPYFKPMGKLPTHFHCLHTKKGGNKNSVTKAVCYLTLLSHLSCLNPTKSGCWCKICISHCVAASATTVFELLGRCHSCCGENRSLTLG